MDVQDVLRAQDGVISRRQVLEAGKGDSYIKRRLARREWARVHPGVYVNHTGPPTWAQLAWAAVLFYWPAALAGPSALHAARVRGYEPKDDGAIHVIVDRTRTVRRRVGIAVFQVARAPTQYNEKLSPPRQSVEHALLQVAARKKKLEASIAVLADAVQDGRTTAERLMRALDDRPKLRHRAILGDVLADVDEGVRSVLEHRYLRLVERAHGLPRGERQQRLVLAGKPGYPDVEYKEQRVLVHLDGRVGHSDSLDRWADFDRDIAALVDTSLGIRAGWAQVLDHCRLAGALEKILQQRGWLGAIRACGPKCTAFSTSWGDDAVQTP
jgi:hypothetical protein